MELKKELMKEIRNLKEEISQLKNEIDELKNISSNNRYNHNVPG
jgi:regulator of replication initiation timing